MNIMMDLRKCCNNVRMKVRISKFGKLIGLIRTLDEFKDGPSVTSLRVRELKTLSLIKLLNTITSN